MLELRTALVMEGVVVRAVAEGRMRIWHACIALSRASALMHDGS